MGQETPQEDIGKKRVVYQTPGMEAVTIRRDVEYRTTGAGALTMDVYYPPNAKNGALLPAVIFVLGYSDLGAQKIFGCKLKEMGAYVSWAQLAAASGLVAITYVTHEPGADIQALLQYVRQNAAGLGINENKIGVWACSGNVPNALSLLMQEVSSGLKCAVLCYGLMLDSDGSANVAEAAKMFGFVNPAAGRSVDDLPQELPLFIVRAGRDNAQLNETIDRFLAEALGRNLPVTFVNHAPAPHAFDLFDDNEATREVIRQILAFMRSHLCQRPGPLGGLRE